MYHEVVPDGTETLPPYSVTQSQLRDVLKDFAARGYTSGSLDDVVGGQQQVNSNSRKRLVLTFDDGTSDFVEYALPVLQELGFSATLFIVAGLVGKRRVWTALDGQPALTPVPLLGTTDIRDLRHMGFTIGSHTVSHPWLPALNYEDVSREVRLSRVMLSDLLGEPVRWFAYPYVAADLKTRSLVQEAGYDGACGGPNRAHEHYYLNRIDASMFSLPELRMRCNGFYHLTRQALRQAQGKAG